MALRTTTTRYRPFDTYYPTFDSSDPFISTTILGWNCVHSTDGSTFDVCISLITPTVTIYYIVYEYLHMPSGWYRTFWPTVILMSCCIHSTWLLHWLHCGTYDYHCGHLHCYSSTVIIQMTIQSLSVPIEVTFFRVWGGSGGMLCSDYSVSVVSCTLRNVTYIVIDIVFISDSVIRVLMSMNCCVPLWKHAGGR